MKTYLRCVFAVTMLALIIVAFLSVRVANERIDKVTRLTQKAHRRIAVLEARTQTKGVEHEGNRKHGQ